MPGIGRGFEAEPTGLDIEAVAKHLVGFVHVDRSAGQSAELVGTANVIDMGVGDHDHLHAEGVALQNRHDLADVVTGVDNDCLMGGFIADHGAIAFEHPHRQNRMDHH